MTKRPNRVAAGNKVSSHSQPKVCVCGVAFLGTGKQIYCSRLCKEAAKRAVRVPGACRQCGAMIAARAGQRYCSDACRRVGRFPQTARDCVVCGIAFAPPRRGGKATVCSPACKTVADSAAKYTRRVGAGVTQFAQIATELENRSGN